jgi:hypothetical protein
MPDSATALKLVALDREGLSVISAHMQDSCVKPAEIVWSPKQSRFVLGAMRYDWAAAKLGRHERIGSALRFDRVLKVSQIGMAAAPNSATLNLLGVTFEKTEAPSGMVLLAFADGGLIRLDVECLEVALRDIGPRAAAESCAGHALTAYAP